MFVVALISLVSFHCVPLVDGLFKHFIECLMMHTQWYEQHKYDANRNEICTRSHYHKHQLTDITDDRCLIPWQSEYSKRITSGSIFFIFLSTLTPFPLHDRQIEHWNSRRLASKKESMPQTKPTFQTLTALQIPWKCSKSTRLSHLRVSKEEMNRNLCLLKWNKMQYKYLHVREFTQQQKQLLLTGIVDCR